MADRTLLFWDADCGVCTFFRNVVLRLDLRGRIVSIPIGSRESDPYLGDLDEDRRWGSMHVVSPDGTRSSAGPALLHLLAALPVLRGVGSVLESRDRGLPLLRAAAGVLGGPAPGSRIDFKSFRFRLNARSVPGVSRIPRASANRGSFTIHRNGSFPIFPLPMCSWRSEWDPRPCFESFRWRAFTRHSPRTASISRSSASYRSGERKSYPAAREWHVSTHTPRRSPYREASTISRSSSHVRPRVVPPPAVFSRTGVTVGASAFERQTSRLCATRWRPAGTPFPMWAPGWKITYGTPRVCARSSSSMNAVRATPSIRLLVALRLIR